MRLDWTWRHGPVSGPVHAVSGLATAAVVAGLPAVDTPAWWVATAGTAGLGMIWWRARRAATATSTLVWRSLAWSAGSGWLLYTLVNGIGTGAVCTLAAGAAALAAAGRSVNAHERQLQQQAHQAAEAYRHQMAGRALNALADEWASRIKQLCGVSVQIIGIEKWIRPAPDGGQRETGYTLEAVLPPTGVSWRALAKQADALANAADLPLGCGVEVTQGIGRRRALLDVSTVDALTDVIAIPPAGPATVNDPLDIGVRRDGSPALASIRWESWVIVGSVDSGKSNELRTIMNRLVETDDTLIVVIDKNGGGLALPYLQPWVAGEIPHPPIVAVVDTDAEAAKLVRFFGALIGARKQSQAAAMAAANDDKVAVSRRVPQIVVIADEAGSLPLTVQNGLVDLSDRGRASGVRIVYCALRATAIGGYLPKPILVQSKVRIGMRVTAADELRYLYGRAFDPADTPAAGYGFVGIQGESPYVHKGYRTPPSAAADAARRSTGWRPHEIEQETLDLLDPKTREIWTGIWDRHKHIVAAAAGAPISPPAGEATRHHPSSPQRHPGGMEGALDDMAAARQRMRDAMDAAARSRPDADDTDDAFEDIVSDIILPPPLLVRLLNAFEQAGAEQMHTADLEERIEAVEGDLGRLLPQLGIKSLPHAFPRPGRKKARGYARADIEQAAEEIREGRRPVPEKVAEWQPHQP